MDILKAFSLCDEQYPINIQGTIENPLFQANQIGNMLGMVNIRKVLANYDNNLKVVTESYTLGGTQKTTFLTEAGLYRLLARSNKPIAEKFQLWMIQVLKEIRLTGEYKLKQQFEIDSKLIQQNAKIEIHNKLLQLYHQKNVVYICKLKDENNDKFVIKIGSTQNIKERMTNISNTYGVIPLVLDVFENYHHIKLENAIHSNESIRTIYYPITKLNGIITKETFIVNDEEYKSVLCLINEEITKMNSHDMTPKQMIELQIKLKEMEIKEQEIQLKTYEAEIRKKELDMKSQENDSEMINKLSEITEKIKTEPVEEKQVEIHNEIEVLKNTFVKRRIHSRSPKVFQFDKDTFELVTIYDSVIDVIRNFEGTSHNGLREASKANTIYKNYRWVLQDRDIAEIPKPQPTVLSSNKSIEYIAMIDVKQTKIMDVFASQRDAAQSRNLAGFSTISRAIKNGSMSSGHYWKLFDKCSQEMQDEYLSKNSLPERFIKKNSRFVIQIDPITNKEIKRFGSITDVTLKFQMSHITLKKVSDNNEIHNGYKWKIAE
jgi:prophage antirepressor-like protein